MRVVVNLSPKKHGVRVREDLSSWNLDRLVSIKTPVSHGGRLSHL
jgi:hypothetical protein